jgi:hypothetical protein
VPARATPTVSNATPSNGGTRIRALTYPLSAVSLRSCGKSASRS